MKTFFKLLVFYLVMIIIGVLLGLFASYINFDLSGVFTKRGLISLIILFYPILVFSVFVHELGHLVFGLSTGYRFVSFRILSFMIKKENNRFVIKKFKLKGTLGQCLLEATENNKENMFLYNAGGVFFNLIAGFLFIPLLVIFQSDLLFLPISFLIIMNFIFVYINWANIKGATNDGNNYRELKRSSMSRKAFYELLSMNKANNEGFDLRDMHFGIDFLELDLKENIQVNYAIYLVLYFHLLLEMEKAKSIIEEILKVYPHKNNTLSLMALSNKHFQDYYFDETEKTNNPKIIQLYKQKNIDPMMNLFNLYIEYKKTNIYDLKLEKIYNETFESSPSLGIKPGLKELQSHLFSELYI